MVTFVSQYDVFVQMVHSSDSYLNATEQGRKEMDEYLKSQEVRNHFGSRIIPQFTLHESIVLEFTNCGAFQQRTPQEQQNIGRYLSSKKFKGVVDKLESRVNNFFNV
ncbi:MAG: hypothetical protein AABW51_02530 [Nanoarchaeota archaeon]|mgnify:CR=1 FL=1